MGTASRVPVSVRKTDASQKVMDELPDFVAQMDQAEQLAKDVARPIIAFHNALRDGGIHEVTVNEIVKIYAASVLNVRSVRH